MYKFVLFDGAFGTELSKLGDFDSGSVNATSRKVVLQIHKSYIDSGCDIISSNTFNAAKYDNGIEMAIEGMAIARAACGNSGTKIAFDCGATGKLLEPYGDMTEDECADIYRKLAEAVLPYAPDYFLLETFFDKNELICACKAIRSVTNIPIITGFTLAYADRTLMGNTLEEMSTALVEAGTDMICLNCVAMDEQLILNVKKLLDVCEKPVLVMANNGKPVFRDGVTSYEMSAREYCDCATKLIELGVKFIGGCCGTTPEHILLLDGLRK